MDSRRGVAGPVGTFARSLIVLVAATLLAACARASQGVASHDIVFENVHYRVVMIDLGTANLGLHWRDPDTGKPFSSIHALQQWGASHGRKLLFASNAGIYDAQGEPLGMYVENGRTLKPLNTAHGDPAAGNFRCCRMVCSRSTSRAMPRFEPPPISPPPMRSRSGPPNRGRCW